MLRAAVNFLPLKVTSTMQVYFPASLSEDPFSLIKPLSSTEMYLCTGSQSWSEEKDKILFKEGPFILFEVFPFL